MPQGVEHCLDQGLRIAGYVVSKPQMPQGVEHTPVVAPRATLKSVSKPQMPQGVEHSLCRVAHDSAPLVSKPQMPQGVEHRGILDAQSTVARDGCRNLRCRKALSTRHRSGAQ